MVTMEEKAVESLACWLAAELPITTPNTIDVQNEEARFWRDRQSVVPFWFGETTKHRFIWCPMFREQVMKLARKIRKEEKK